MLPSVDRRCRTPPPETGGRGRRCATLFSDFFAWGTGNLSPFAFVRKMNIGFTKNLPDSKSPGIVQRRMRLCTRLSAMYRLHEYVTKHQRQDAKHDAQHASATVFPALIQSMHMTPKVCPRAWFVSRFLYICSPLNSLNPEASIANEPARERKDDLDVVAGLCQQQQRTVL